jgi:aspartyl-tRNA(Asn)/glutamyl-tRNA(Gln) amidotransferase subunit C
MEKPDINIKYVSELARIELSAEQQELFQKDLESIVGYIAELSELDVEGVEPTAHASKLSNVWREDAVGTSLDRKAVLSNAPDIVDSILIKVPQVLPGEGSN